MFIEKIPALEERVLSIGIDIKNTKHPIVTRLGLARERYASGDKARERADACYVQFLLEDLATIGNASKDLYQHFVSLLYFYYSWVETENDNKETRTTPTNRYVRVGSKKYHNTSQDLFGSVLSAREFWVEASVGMFV